MKNGEKQIVEANKKRKETDLIGIYEIFSKTGQKNCSLCQELVGNIIQDSLKPKEKRRYKRPEVVEVINSGLLECEKCVNYKIID